MAAQTNRRGQARIAVSVGGQLILEDGHERPCVVTNLSWTGVRLRASVAPAAGDTATLVLPAVGTYEIVIVWVADSDVGARFLADPDGLELLIGPRPPDGAPEAWAL